VLQDSGRDSIIEQNTYLYLTFTARIVAAGYFRRITLYICIHTAIGGTDSNTGGSLQLRRLFVTVIYCYILWLLSVIPFYRHFLSLLPATSFYLLICSPSS